MRIGPVICLVRVWSVPANTVEPPNSTPSEAIEVLSEDSLLSQATTRTQVLHFLLSPKEIQISDDTWT